ncbi:threonine--tRNA ligase [candidate division WWE3 bacterium CG08_land_8_20_14_0_20_41_10]|uniref:Threonine--tRNA ligase n=1 Tax=candidate division WWE3 bacterium CG08_land_8_20_14_0_20_41_10 TaxID=1975085 RepID=A0A2H0XEY2_UNCKA|nr:MAG: threonine--tRNA ligase [candidate division WWE3 bacterium CG08_land_8_20_14_0_20_41_10]
MSKVKNELKNDPLMPLRHSAEHVLHCVMQRLYPELKKVMGPPIEDGFYFDFDLDYKITPEDLPKIESEMQKMIDANLPIVRKEVSSDEAKKLFANNQYKTDNVAEIELRGEKVSIYTTGNPQSPYYDVDLCAGPHVESTGKIKAFKLLSIAGAYYKGNEKNKMLQRIYGTAFDSKEALNEHLNNIEEAKKRDHRKLGKDLDLFSVDDYVGPGLILWHPKLSVVREEIELYWRQEHRKRGYEYVYTPHVGLSNLWQTSGHLDFFKEGMYPQMSMESKSEDEQTSYYVKPMSCPFHVRIYKSRPRSYKELPIRWCELGNVYRYEESGVLHGMLRVRGFTQDDAHIICREDQFVEEVNSILDFALEMNKTLGFDKLNVYLSVRNPENKTKYVGEDRVWQLAEKALEEILVKRNVDFKKDVGGAKFYGPAIDLKAVDSLGREWQGTTIQLDMNLPARFGMVYVDQNGKEVTPIMLHRTLLGSMERFVGTLIEHVAGAFPVWLAPVQVVIIPISEKNNPYAQKVANLLRGNKQSYPQEKIREAFFSGGMMRSVNLRVEVDERDETMQAKIRDAQMQKVPYMLVLGSKEESEESVNVRLRDGKTVGMIKTEEFAQRVVQKYLTKALDLW